MAQKLTWLDQEYLGQYDREDCHADSAIALQPPFEQPVQREITYSVTEEEGTKDRTYLSINTVVGYGFRSGTLCGLPDFGIYPD